MTIGPSRDAVIDARGDNTEYNPRRYQLTGENQVGSLEIGKRSYPLRVTEMNAQEFHALMDYKSSCKISRGGKARLKILGKDCKIVVKNKRLTGEGMVRLDLKQIDEACKQETSRKGWFSRSPSSRVSVSGGDSLMPIVMVVAVFITILILPSFGGRWGTAKRISDFVEWTWDTMASSLKKS
jgi:hypothetical protein